MDEWFPEIKADIFISHSHNDIELVQYLAGYLEVEYGLKAFIDSAVWGHSSDLLKKLDDKYCFQSFSGTYSYEKRNFSTSHIHMMLSVALMKMINRCECLFFLNSDKSILPNTLIKDAGKTLSPWLFSELAFSRLVEKIKPERYSLVTFSESTDMQLLKSASHLSIEYPADLSHLTKLDIDSMNAWHESYSNNLDNHPLDLLYINNEPRKAKAKSRK